MPRSKDNDRNEARLVLPTAFLGATATLYLLVQGEWGQAAAGVAPFARDYLSLAIETGMWLGAGSANAC